MYQEYDKVSSVLEEELENQGKGKSYISTFRRSVRDCKAYMVMQGKPYSAEMAAEWLLFIKARFSHAIYKQLRYPQYRIAQIIVGEDVSRELFYLDIQSDFDRLPLWAQKSVSLFLQYSGTGDHFKAGASTFLYRQIQKGLTSLSGITCRIVADYYLAHGTIRGVNQYLHYLVLHHEIGLYVSESYNFIYSSRILDFTEIDVQIALSNESEHGIIDYRHAHSTMINELKAIGYSKTILKTANTTANEFGIFLEYNHLSYSFDLVGIFIDSYRKRISENVSGVRRCLLMLGDYLKGKNYSEIPRLYTNKLRPDFPHWIAESIESYLAQRKRNHAEKSTLVMDRSAIRRFVEFIDSRGCTSVAAINAEMIKAFHLADEHRTAEGKNAYNRRIRGFLRYLAKEGLITSHLIQALPTANGIKVRPAVILTAKQSEKLTNYCTKAENNGHILDAAVLRIATQTGLRAIDISLLKHKNIDWDKMEFSLIQKKTKKHIRIPFSKGVGNTIWRYTMEERPTIKSKYIFISSYAPFDHLSTSQIRNIVGKALRSKNSGVHILRKTFASRLLVSGSSLSLITDALGHETEETLDPYLDTNGEMMRQCALPLSSRISYTGGLL